MECPILLHYGAWLGSIYYLNSTSLGALIRPSFINRCINLELLWAASIIELQARHSRHESKLKSVIADEAKCSYVIYAIF